MKKLCSLFLVLCMVLSLIVVPATADAATTTTGATATPLTGPITTIPEGAPTVTVGATTYTVIRTVADFKAMGAGNYILANDLDFTPVATTEEGETADDGIIKDPVVSLGEGDFTLDGNGYTLNNLSVAFSASESLFVVKKGNATIKNLKIVTGTITAPSKAAAALLFSAASQGENILIDNVDIHVTDYTAVDQQALSIYVHKNGAKNLTIKNCELTGKMNFGFQMQAGFVMQATGNTTIENCIVDAEISKNGNRNVGFVGEALNGDLKLIDCTLKGVHTDNGGKWGLSFVSGVNSCNVTLTRCKNAAVTYGKDRAAGFVGGYLSDKSVSHIVFEDCEFAGTLWSATGLWIAEPRGDQNTYEFKGTQKITGYVMGANLNTVGAEFYNELVVDTSKLDAASGALAYVYALAQKSSGVTDPAEIYGQMIGVDKNPVKGGATVYRGVDAEGNYVYRNRPYRDVVTLEIAEGATTTTVDGVEYKVVRTVADFKAMTAGNYILANDIDFTGEQITGIIVTADGDFNLKGNTYALKGIDAAFATNYTGMIKVTGKAIIEDLAIFGKVTNTATIASLVFAYSETMQAKAVNVTVNVDVENKGQAFGLFMGKHKGATATATFEECVINSTFTSTDIQSAGFVGLLEAPATFLGCSTNVNMTTSANRVSPYVGQINADVAVTFTDCTASGRYVSTTNLPGAASYVGACSGTTSPVINFVNCSSDMVILGYEKVGGFVSGLRDEAHTPKVSFTACINAAVVISAGTVGAWTGEIGAGTFTVDSKSLNNATVIGYNIVTVSENENATAKVTDLSGLKIADGSLAYALANAQSVYGFAPEHIFGQDLSVAGSVPTMNEKTVYASKDLAEKPCYSNVPPITYETIPAGVKTFDVGGTTYIVIRTKEDIEKMRGTNSTQINYNNYILANDIDMGGHEIVGAKDDKYGFVYWWSGTLDGNGFSITNFKITNSDNTGFFDGHTTQVDIIVKNITFGTKAEPIHVTSNGTNGTGVVVGGLNNNATLRVENSVVNCFIDDNNPSSKMAQKGAFIGDIEKTSPNSSVTLINCTANGTIYGKNKIGGLMGNNYSKSPVTMIDCVNNCTIYGQVQVGGIIGFDQGGGELYLENCVNNGTIHNINGTDSAYTLVAEQDVGGILGRTNGVAGAEGNITIRNCVNNGEILGGNNPGQIVGLHQLGYLDIVYSSNAPVDQALAVGNFTESATCTVTFTELNVAEIATLDELKAAFGTTGVYTLTADINLGGKLNVSMEYGKNVVIILAGKTLTGEVVVSGLGTLKLMNGTIKTTTDDAALTLIADSALTLDNVTVEGKKVGAAVYGALTAEDSTFKSTEGNAVEFHEGTTSTLNNCGSVGTILGHSDGKLDTNIDLADGMHVTIKGSGDYGAIVWESAGTLTIVGGVYNAGTGTALLAKNGDITVQSGTFKGSKFIDAAATASAKPKVTVNGGTFYGDITVADGATVALGGGRYEKALPLELLEKCYESKKNDESGMYEISYHTCSFEEEFSYNNSGNHKKKCTFPGCEEGVIEAHKWGDAADLGDGTHAKVCTVCAGKGNVAPHKMECVDNGDGTHSNACSGCNLSEKVAHNLESEAYAIEGNKHEKYCADCEAIVTEDCVGGADGKCTGCGATVGTPDKGGDNGGDSGKKGCGSAVSGGLFALLSILAIPAITVRKRREDR